MKKKFIFGAGIVLLLAACGSEDDIVSNDSEQLAPVTVRVDGFAASKEDFPDASGGTKQGTTRATAVADYEGVSFITLAFYASNGTEVYKHTKSKNEADFGEFSLSLPLGSYTMVVLGYALYDDDALTLTSPIQAEWTVNAPRETFAATQVVNVTSTTALNLSATLNRIVSQLKVISTDNRTANVEKIRMTFAAGGKRFSPTTGLATVNTGSVSTVSIGVEVGERSGSVGYVFLATDEQTMDVTIETLDADGNTIFTKTVNNVPFQRNRKTKLTGAIYSASASAGSILVNTDWLSDYSDTF